MTIHDLIKAQRKRSGLTQRELAKRVGVSYALIHQWENGVGRPAFERLAPLAKALDMDLDAFFSFPGSPYKGELVEEADELALIAVWRGISPADRSKALRLLRVMADFPGPTISSADGGGTPAEAGQGKLQNVG